jgi:hypothetical protein
MHLLIHHLFVQKENVIDATRTKDGVRVVLKCVHVESDEYRIALYLSSSKLLSDSRNRTVPIKDVISLPDDKEYVLLVMPYLRVFNTPPFHCCSEFVDAFRQFLQVFTLSFNASKSRVLIGHL